MISSGKDKGQRGRKLGTKVTRERRSDNEATVLKGLCMRPWAVDREVGRALGLKMSTLTAIKNRLRRAGMYRKANIPAYHRLGYSVLSLSSIRAPTTLDHAFGNAPTGSLVVFGLQDPLGALVMAYHRGLYEFKGFEAVLDGWDHQLFPLTGARHRSQFDFTNSVNKASFGNRFDAGEGPIAREGLYELRTKIENRVLGAFIRTPEANALMISKASGVTRQSVIKIRDRLRRKGLIHRTALVDPKALGLGLGSAAVLDLKGTISDAAARDIERTARPFWFQSFGSTCVLLACHADYDGFASEVNRLGRLKGIAKLNARVFGLKDGELRYRFELAD